MKYVVWILSVLAAACATESLDTVEQEARVTCGGPNEVICPVCNVVIRSTRELRPGDRVYCMACMARMRVVRGADGRLEAEVEY